MGALLEFSWVTWRATGFASVFFRRLAVPNHTLKVLVQFILADSLRDLSSLVLTQISRLQRAKFDLESCLAKPVAYTKFRGASKWEWAF